MRRAFTLIELLVVISIIALLIAILLPSLGAARKSAQNVQCLSNQKQQGVAFHVHAAENKGQLLVGSLGTAYQNAYWLYTATGKYVTNGVLLINPGIEDPQAYYCPRQINQSLSYDTAGNPWLQAGAATRMAFNLRPFDEKYQTVRWADTGDPKQFFAVNSANQRVTLPNLEDFESDEGLMADNLSRDSLVDSAHQTGINAIRVDGSGRYISRNLFDTALPGAGAFTATNNPAIQSIWEYAIKSEEEVP